MGQPGSASDRFAVDPAAAIAVTVLGVAAMFAGAPLLAPTGLGLRAQIAVGTALLALPSAVLLLGHRAARGAVLGRVRPTLEVIGLSALLGAALWAASVGLMEMQDLVWPLPQAYLDGFRAIHRALAPSGPLDAMVSLAVIAVLPGLCEELVMRGVLLPALTGPLGAFWAVVGSAAGFAAIHDDRYRFLFTFSIGLVLGAVRLRSASLWPSVTAHGVLNALTFVIAPLVDDPSQADKPDPLLGTACLVFGSALAVPLLRRLDRARRSGGRATG